MEPGVLLWLVVAEALYLRAIRTLHARGHAVPRLQVASWHLGIGLQAVGLLSPVADHADELLSAHMVEHLLIADLAAPFLLVGLRTPVLQFILPRPVLVPLARRRRLRSALAVLRQPLAAVPLYVLVLYGWHIAPLFEAATRHAPVHALQHMTFVATGILVWWPLLEPAKRRLTGALWKILHILGARLAGMMLGMAFIVARTPFYTGVYGADERAFGLSAIGDQQTAGAIMMIVDVLLMVCAMAFFFWRAAAEEDRQDAAAGAAQATTDAPPLHAPA